MAIIGEKIYSIDLGFKGTLSWYIWAQCVGCGKQSWVRAIQIKDSPWVCAHCSHKKSHLHKTTAQILQSGIRECKKCHRFLLVDLKHFHKASKSALGITNICKDCSKLEYQRECKERGRVKITCNLCGRTELVWNTGKHKSICGGCSQRISGCQKLPRGNYKIRPNKLIKGICGRCNIEYPATIQYFRSSKLTKNGLDLGTCRKCRNKIRHQERKVTLKGRINNRISGYIRQALNGTKGYRSWESLVGYTVEDLIKHLQKHFTKGMTWDNYGKWHIDHVMPQSAFHFTSPEDIDFKRCWALSNLQPLWAKDNIAKSDKILKPFQPSLKLEKQNVKGIA